MSWFKISLDDISSVGIRNIYFTYEMEDSHMKINFTHEMEDSHMKINFTHEIVISLSELKHLHMCISIFTCEIT